MKGVYDHSSVGDALRRELALVVTEAKAELGRQAMPVVLGASSLAVKMRADRAATGQAKARGVRRCLCGVDGVVHPDGAVEGRGATRRDGGEEPQGGVSLRLRGTGRVEGGGRRRRPSREKALDGAHQSIEGGAGVALAEVSRGKPANKAINAEATHGLVTEAEAGVDVAAHDEAPAGNHPAVLVDSKHAGPERSTGAAREDAEVICILEILSEHDVTDVEEGRELGD
jgi:hypothetical protein